MAVLQGSQSKVEPTDCVYINSLYFTGQFLLWNCLPENRQHCCVVFDITTCSSPLGRARCCAACSCVNIPCPEELSYCAFVSRVIWFVSYRSCHLLDLLCIHLLVCVHTRKLFIYFLSILKSLNDKQQIWVFGEMIYIKDEWGFCFLIMSCPKITGTLHLTQVRSSIRTELPKMDMTTNCRGSFFAARKLYFYIDCAQMMILD